MEQLRVAFAWLKRQHFWVLAVLITAVSLFCWFSAAGALQEAYKKNQKQIKDEFDAQKRLRSEEFHANDDINNQQRLEIQAQGESVTQAWQQLYKRQQEEVLKWPQELGSKFRDYVVGLDFGDPIPVDLRNVYMNYIGSHFSELPKKIDAQVYDDSQRGSRGRVGSYRPPPQNRSLDRGGRDEPLVQQDYIVDWQDQQAVRAELDMPVTPSAWRIWVTQEDLWVIHTLLGIIANTNEAAGADRHSNAAVRVIESLDVGAAAAKGSRTAVGGQLLMPPGAAAPGAMNDPYSMDRGSEAMMGRGISDSRSEGLSDFGGMRGGAVTEEQELASLLSGRYLDAQDRPIVVSGIFSPSQLGLEYKRLPVRMQLIMDQRWLTHLITECANAPLQVEVQQVTINPGGSDRRGGGFSSRGSDFSASRSSSSRSDDIKTFPQEPNIVPVIIQGVIYIFNEPDPAVLQLDQPTA